MAFWENPWVWLRRVRHRCGYGVHSPFAYDMITQVFYNEGTYYAHDTLDQQFSWWQRRLSLGKIRRAHLLLRLSNRWQPNNIWVLGAETMMLHYLKAGCQHSDISVAEPQSVADMVYLDACHALNLWSSVSPYLHDGSMVVVDNLQSNLTLWRDILADPRTRVTFDLYSVGIAVFDPMLQRQDYIVNW